MKCVKFFFSMLISFLVTECVCFSMPCQAIKFIFLLISFLILVIYINVEFVHIVDITIAVHIC